MKKTSEDWRDKPGVQEQAKKSLAAMRDKREKERQEEREDARADRLVTALSHRNETPLPSPTPHPLIILCIGFALGFIIAQLLKV